MIVHGHSFAAWYLEKYIGQDRREISDDRYEFQMEDIKCIVGKTDFQRMPNDQIAESRTLQCWVSKDTFVLIRGQCDKPLWEMRDLYIEKKGKAYWPTLLCGPKKTEK
jgi:hypothetical protein